MDTPKPVEGTMDDFHKIELEKIISTTQSFYTTRVTAGSIAGTITIGVIGVTFNGAVINLKEWRAVSFFVAAFVTLGFLLVDLGIRSAIVSHYLRGLELCKKYVPNDKNALSSLFIFSPKIREYVEDLIKKPNNIRRKKLGLIGLKFPSVFGFWLPLIAVVVEIVIGLLFIFHILSF